MASEKLFIENELISEYTLHERVSIQLLRVFAVHGIRIFKTTTAMQLVLFDYVSRTWPVKAIGSFRNSLVSLTSRSDAFGYFRSAMT
ncbi:hypothetical protein EVAR_57040_1 [Eumeta japonica]|uniref:Uncharacterized protein n=1 Tax=Eumeta variegata TaxID=151549 RepID=A0A4C1YTL1_EUMVA|nr:hypothetical protein EVAR_57040_1 [Eumeta japonica]